MPYSQRLDGYDYDLLISAVEFTSLRFTHDEEYVQEMTELLIKLKERRPLVPERTK
tara:strand:- start:356 stop:523 length:168 start_codon:yes stop_codon:yes gene_type:complete